MERCQRARRLRAADRPSFDPVDGNEHYLGIGGIGPGTRIGKGAWTATVDPAAGTIAAIAGDNEARFDLTFTPPAI